jgi:hypothetical protein
LNASATHTLVKMTLTRRRSNIPVSQDQGLVCCIV